MAFPIVAHFYEPETREKLRWNESGAVIDETKFTFQKMVQYSFWRSWEGRVWEKERKELSGMSKQFLMKNLPSTTPAQARDEILRIFPRFSL